MGPLKIGIQLASLRQPFRKALHTAAQLGAQAVEIDARGEIRPRDMTRTAIRQVRRMLDDHNLRVSAVSFRTHRGYNVLDGLDQRVAATKQAMQLAYDLGGGVVVNQVGRVPATPSGSPWDLLLQTLSDLGRHGEHVGTSLAARTGSEEPSLLRRLIDALPAGSIGVDLDPGSLIINGYSVREAAETLGPYILHVHARDGVRDAARGRGLEVPLGRGSAEFPELCSMLEQHQYRGYFTIERQGADDPIAEIGQAVEYLSRLTKG